MKTSNSGRSQAISPSMPQQKNTKTTLQGKSGGRTVKHYNKKDSALARNTQKKPFIPLSKRKITSTDNLSNCVMTKTLTILAEASVPKLKNKYKAKKHNKLEASINELKREIKNGQMAISECEKKIAKHEAFLKKLHSKTKTLDGKAANDYKDSLQSKLQLQREVAKIKLNVVTKQSLIESKQTKQAKLSRPDKEPTKAEKDALSSSIKLLIGLRSALPNLKDPKNSDKTYKVSLKSLTYNSNESNLTLNNLQLFLDQYREDPDGSIIIGIPCAKGKAQGTDTPISIRGEIRISPPLSEPFKDIISCDPKFIPHNIKAFKTALKPIIKEVSKPDSEKKLTDYLNLKLDDIDIASNETSQGAGALGTTEKSRLNERSALSVTQILSPLLTGWKLSKDKTSALKSERKREDSQRQCEHHKKEIQNTQPAIKELKDLLTKVNGQEPRKILSEQLRTCETELKEAQKALQKSMAELKKLSQPRQSLSQQKEPAQKELQYYQNGLKLFFALRSLSEQEKPSQVSIPEQEIDITGTSQLRLSQLNMNLKQLTRNNDGSLDLVIPDIRTQVAIHNSSLKTQENLPVAFRDVNVHLSPKLADLVLKATELDFPIELAEIEELAKEHANLTTAYKDPVSNELSPKKGDDHITVRLGDVIFDHPDSPSTCHSNVRPDRDQLAKKVSTLLANSMSPKELESMLSSSLGMGKESANKIMNLLSLGLLGPNLQTEAPKPEEAGPPPASLPDKRPDTSPTPKKARKDPSGGVAQKTKTPNNAVPAKKDLLQDNTPEKSLPKTKAPTPPAPQPSMPNTLAEVDLRNCRGVSNLTSTNNNKGEPSVQFDLQQPTQNLAENSKWVTLLCAGSEKITLEVTCPGNAESIQLDRPEVKTKQLGFLGWRSQILDFLLKNQLSADDVSLQMETKENSIALEFRNNTTSKQHE